MDNQEIKNALAEWFANQKQWTTRKQFANSIGIPYSTLKKYFSGVHFPSGKNLQKLYNATNLNCFKQKSKTQSDQKSINKEAINKSEIVKRLLFILNEELEYFKNGKTEERDLLRNILSGHDVGYITALLDSIFDEERFKNWLIMNTYKFSGK